MHGHPKRALYHFSIRPFLSRYGAVAEEDFAMKTSGMPQPHNSINTAQATAAHQKWQATIRKDIDYDNLSPADYQAMEADLQRRPISRDEDAINRSFRRQFLKLGIALFMIFIFLVTKLINALSA